MRHRTSYARLVCLPGATLALSVVAALTTAASEEAINVRLGYSEVMRTDQQAETVIVGNDQVANATIAAQNTIVITGHSIGSTNLILLDETGAEISSSVVQVIPIDPRPRRAIRLIAGGVNESSSVYVCGPGPGCAPGDDLSFGPCMYPDDIAADGSRCGDRAASVRPGGVDGEGRPEERPEEAQ